MSEAEWRDVLWSCFSFWLEFGTFSCVTSTLTWDFFSWENVSNFCIKLDIFFCMSVGQTLFGIFYSFLWIFISRSTKRWTARMMSECLFSPIIVVLCIYFAWQAYFITSFGIIWIKSIFWWSNLFLTRDSSAKLLWKMINHHQLYIPDCSKTIRFRLWSAYSSVVYEK